MNKITVLIFIAAMLFSSAGFSLETVIAPETILPEDEPLPQKTEQPPQDIFNQLINFCITRNKKAIKSEVKKTKKVTKLESKITPESLHECACVAQVLWEILPEGQYDSLLTLTDRKSKIPKNLKEELKKSKDVARKRCLYDSQFPEQTFFEVR